MKQTSLCALVLAAAGCISTPPPQPGIPIVDISASSGEVTPKVIEEFFPSASYSERSNQILNALFTNPNSRYSHRYSFEKEEFKVVVYFSDLDEKKKDVLQYYVINNSTNTMIVFLDGPPYGSLDEWYRCLYRGKGTLADTRNTFNCEMMDSKEQEEVTESFQETITLAHQALLQKKIIMPKNYKKRFNELLEREWHQALFRELKTVP